MQPPGAFAGEVTVQARLLRGLAPLLLIAPVVLGESDAGEARPARR